MPTAERIEELAAENRKERLGITWLKRPLRVTVLFLQCIVVYVPQYTWTMLTHPLTVFGLLPVAAAWYAALQTAGPHIALMEEAHANAQFVVWWVGLGVLSSVGLGSGMHTGTLFLFPHIFKVVMTAETECQHASFNSRANMWWAIPPGDWFACDPGASPVTELGSLWWPMYWKLVPAAILWGAGTAIGEIPPYLTAYTAKRCGLADEDLDEVAELEKKDGQVHVRDPVTAMKIWMITFMKKWGFMGVFVMSAWPNALFDLCGICCGSFLMPFWHFFIACFAGKALVKAPAQLAVLISVFSTHSRQAVIDSIVGTMKSFSLDGWAVKVESGVAKLVNSLNGKGQEEAAVAAASGERGGLMGSGVSFGDLFGWAMFAIIGIFALSCIELFAQARQRSVDEQYLRTMAQSEQGLNNMRKYRARSRSPSPARRSSSKKAKSKSPAARKKKY